MRYWTIQAFQLKLKDKNFPDSKTFNMGDYCLVKVVADSEREALKKAKGIIKRKYYRIYEVYDAPEDTLHEDMQMAQLEIQKKMLDFIKGHI